MNEKQIDKAKAEKLTASIKEMNAILKSVDFRLDSELSEEESAKLPQDKEVREKQEKELLQNIKTNLVPKLIKIVDDNIFWEWFDAKTFVYSTILRRLKNCFDGIKKTSNIYKWRYYWRIAQAASDYLMAAGSREFKSIGVASPSWLEILL